MLQGKTISRRSFLRLAGAGTLTMTVAACATPVAPAAAPAGGESEPSAEAISLIVQGNQEREQGVADTFKDKQPDVTVQFINVTGIDHEEVASKILSMVAAGERFDLGNAATEATQLYAGQELSVALDDWVKRDEEELKPFFSDCHPSLIEAMMYEGSLYQLPFNFNAANMYYNVQLFEEAGYGHPDPEWTKDQFYEIAKAITKNTGNAETDVFGYAWTNRLWGSWMPWIFVNGGGLLTEERAPGGEWLWETFYADDPSAAERGGGWRWLAPKANDPANVEALEFVVQMLQEGITPAVELGGGATLQGFFTASKLGMTPAGGFWAAALKNAGMAPGTFDVQLFPKWKSQRHQFGTAGKFVFQQSKFQDMGWEYMKHTVSMEGMNAYYTEPFSTPTRRSILTEAWYANSGPPHWQVFYDTLDKHPDTAPIPAPPISNPMTVLFTNYTGLAVTLEQTPQQALDNLQAELEDLYERSGKTMYNLEQ